jgi:hypothetical protein
MKTCAEKKKDMSQACTKNARLRADQERSQWGEQLISYYMVLVRTIYLMRNATICTFGTSESPPLTFRSWAETACLLKNMRDELWKRCNLTQSILAQKVWHRSFTSQFSQGVDTRSFEIVTHEPSSAVVQQRKWWTAETLAMAECTPDCGINVRSPSRTAREICPIRPGF